MMQFSEVTISSLRLRRHYHYCHNRHDQHHRYCCHYYDCFCVIVTATSGEEGHKSIMKEIGWGKSLETDLGRMLCNLLAV